MFHHFIVRAPFVLAWHKCACDRPSAVQLTIAPERAWATADRRSRKDRERHDREMNASRTFLLRTRTIGSGWGRVSLASDPPLPGASKGTPGDEKGVTAIFERHKI